MSKAMEATSTRFYTVSKKIKKSEEIILLASVMLDPRDQIRENANNLSNASSVLSPKLSMSILGAKVS